MNSMRAVIDGKITYAEQISQYIRDYPTNDSNTVEGMKQTLLKGIKAIIDDQGESDKKAFSGTIAEWLFVIYNYLQREISGVVEKDPQGEELLETMVGFYNQLVQEYLRLSEQSADYFDRKKVFVDIDSFVQDKWTQRVSQNIENGLARYVEASNQSNKVKAQFLTYLHSAYIRMEKELLVLVEQQNRDDHNNDDNQNYG